MEKRSRIFIDHSNDQNFRIFLYENPSGILWLIDYSKDDSELLLVARDL